MNKQIPQHNLQAALRRCCASDTWLASMLAQAPFANEAAALEASEHAASVMQDSDWLQAFLAHPKIGRVDSLSEKFSDTMGWASAEQSGVAKAEESALLELAHLNRDYEDKFGFIFIIFATSKSATEMLDALRMRIQLSYADEIWNAAQEQKAITAHRLKKWISELHANSNLSPVL